MPRACASCSITALRSGSAPALASTFTSWLLHCSPACAWPSPWFCSRARGRTGWTRHAARCRGRRRPDPRPRPEPRLAPPGMASRRAVRRSDRRRPFDTPAPAAEPARGDQCGHGLRPGLPRPSRPDTCRDTARLPCPCGPACAARRPRRGDFGAHRTRSAETASASRASASCCAAPVRRRLRRLARQDRAGPILFVGTIEPRKNLPTLFAAYEQLLARVPAAPPLILAGAAVEQSARSWATCAPVARLHGRVDYRGYVSDAERQALYASASMLVLPSFHEGFGLPAVEAMQAGVPVITSTGGALPEVVGTAGITVDPADAAGFTAAMERLLADPAERQRRADAGRRAGTAVLVDGQRGDTARRVSRCVRPAGGALMAAPVLRIGVDAREIIGDADGRRAATSPSCCNAGPPDRMRTPGGSCCSCPAPGRSPCRPRTWTCASCRGTRRNLVGADVPAHSGTPRAARRVFAAAYTAPLALNVPLALTIHDVSFLAHPEWFRTRERMRRQWLTRRSARAAAVVFTDSTFSRDEILRHIPIDPARVEVIAPGISPRHRPARPSSSREPLVLFVGSVFNRRRLPQLIAAFALATAGSPDARLVIVGSNRTWPHQDPRGARGGSRGQRAGRRSQLRGRRELTALYSRASVFAFLSEYRVRIDAARGARGRRADCRARYAGGSRGLRSGGALRAARRRRGTDRRGAPRRARRQRRDERRPAAGRRGLQQYSWDVAAARTLAGIEQAVQRR